MYATPPPTPPARASRGSQGSIVAFSLNGRYQGPAFTNIPEGTYYPAASLYTMPEQAEGASLTFNFGPDFVFLPPQVGARAIAHAQGRQQ